ncbi:MAG TPA: 4-hydroxythreonine-4-phosphate dehydrogenase PdxA [Cellvibrionales bacterium]|nr:4-hydroxythreonine-4-phosphate dehydrogenase PdxA [Cellvibrionales bacterium]
MTIISRIAITPGEPAGIGPDILVQLAQHQQRAQLVAIADPSLLLDRAKRLGLPLVIKSFNDNAIAECAKPGELFVDAIELISIPEPGVANSESGEYVLKTLDRGIALCKNKQLDALVTGPINKHVINQHLSSQDNGNTFFSGHTEYLAEQTNTPRVVMMLATENSESSSLLSRPLRVALATTHLPLRDVADAIQPAMLEETLRILHHDLIAYFGISQPNILVCGLNPHAGEQGDLGDEELRIIEPCLAKLRSQGMQLSAALPADTLFTAKYLDTADAVLAMYHDQGLPVLKSHGFGQAVNITLGLPFIRTSVDHGTAFDLAGTGKASTSSLNTAISMAIDLSQQASNQ